MRGLGAHILCSNVRQNQRVYLQHAAPSVGQVRGRTSAAMRCKYRGVARGTFASEVGGAVCCTSVISGMVAVSFPWTILLFPEASVGYLFRTAGSDTRFCTHYTNLHCNSQFALAALPPAVGEPDAPSRARYTYSKSSQAKLATLVTLCQGWQSGCNIHTVTSNVIVVKVACGSNIQYCATIVCDAFQSFQGWYALTWPQHTVGSI